MRHVLKLICKSRTYQLSVKTNKWNDDDQINFSHAERPQLPAETLLDAIYVVTGSKSKFPGVPVGTRAFLPDSGIKLPDGFLGTFGRPPRESACECERAGGLLTRPIMALVSGPTVNNAISDPVIDHQACFRGEGRPKTDQPSFHTNFEQTSDGKGNTGKPCPVCR